MIKTKRKKRPTYRERHSSPVEPLRRSIEDLYYETAAQVIARFDPPDELTELWIAKNQNRIIKAFRTGTPLGDAIDPILSKVMKEAKKLAPPLTGDGLKEMIALEFSRLNYAYNARRVVDMVTRIQRGNRS